MSSKHFGIIAPQRLALCLLLAFSASGSPASAAPAPLIDDCQYPDAAAAQAAWRPMAHTNPVSVVSLQGRQALHLPCNFAAGSLERVSWDRQLRLDLGNQAGIQFEFLCPNPAPISMFSLYFQSGGGWYHTTFFPEITNGWNTIRIAKGDAFNEGTPAGWSNVTALRLSAWCWEDVNTDLYLRNVRYLEPIPAANREASDAFYRAQSPLDGEFRAFWCHSAFGVDGLTWDEAIRRLATNGFTAILPNMLWGGVAFYDSQVLPVAPDVAKRGDQIAQCLAACRKYGVQAHVWKVNWNLSHRSPRAFVEQLRRAGRLQADAQGKEETWLCPSHPENQKLEIESMLEVARKYDVDGLHFDYIRYPDSQHCFCAGCKARFQQFAGVTLDSWPAPLLTNGPLRAKWYEWRRGHITTVVRAVSEQAHALKPKLKISAAVFRNWPKDRDTIGQDWKLWCDRGWLDFVCPMDYTGSSLQFGNMVARQLQWAGRVPCYPGIGESASASRLDPASVIQQILVSRQYRTGGFVIFNYAVPEANELLPKLGLGITARK